MSNDLKTLEQVEGELVDEKAKLARDEFDLLFRHAIEWDRRLRIEALELQRERLRGIRAQ